MLLSSLNLTFIVYHTPVFYFRDLAASCQWCNSICTMLYCTSDTTVSCSLLLWLCCWSHTKDWWYYVVSMVPVNHTNVSSL